MPPMEEDDDECALAVAYSQLDQATDRDALAGAVAHRAEELARSADGGIPSLREPFALAQAWSQRTDPGARLASAVLLRDYGVRAWSNDRAGATGALAQSADLLRQIEDKSPGNDVLGGRTRLEHVFTLYAQGEGEKASQLLTALVAAPLSWATVDALIKIAQYQYDAGVGDTGYAAFVVAASVASDARTKSAAEAFAARIAVESGQEQAAFALVSSMIGDKALGDALAANRVGPFIATAARAVAALPDGAFDLVAKWPAHWAGTIAGDASQFVYTSARLARLEAIAARDGYAVTPRTSPPDLDDASAVTSLVNDCALGVAIDPAPFELKINMFEHGSPDVTATGNALFAACLRERVDLYFSGSRPSVRARVTVQPI
jgi:hypothetical protein